MNSGNKILLVEDTSSASDELAASLERIGYKITVRTKQVADAVNLAEKARPDIVLLNLNQSGKINLMETACEIWRICGIPVVTIVSSMAEAFREKEHLSGAYGYVKKPYDDKDLIVGLKIAYHWGVAERGKDENEKWLKAIVNGIGEGVIATDKQGKIRMINETAVIMTGWSEEKALGAQLNEVFSIFSEFYGDRLEHLFKKIVSEQCVSEPDDALHLVSRSGEVYPVEVSCNVIKTQENSVSGIVLNFRNLSRSKQMEALLRSERDRAERYLDVAGVMIVVVEADQTVSLINKNGCEVLGLQEKDILAQNWFDSFIPERFREEMRGIFLNAISGQVGMIDYYENPVITKKNGERTVAWHNTLLVNEAGAATGVIYSGEDITERIQVERALLFTQFAVDHAVDGIFWIDQDDAILYANTRACEMLGLKEKEVLNRTLQKALPAIGKVTSGNFFIHLQKNQSVTFEIRQSDVKGGSFEIEISASYFRFRGKEYGCIFLRDVSQRKKIEADIRILSQAVEQSPVSIIITNPLGVVEYSNRQYTKLSGYQQNEILGCIPESVKRALKSVKMNELAQILKTGESWRGVFENRKKNKEIYWSSMTISPLFNYQGELTHYLAAEEDITEKKKAEDSLQKSITSIAELNRDLDNRVREEVAKNRDKDQLLIQQSKLASMGEMIGNIAHQWRQPLNAVGIIIQNIQGAYEFDKLNEDYLNNAVRESMGLLQHMSKTIDDFRYFYRPNREKEKFSIREALEKTVSFIGTSYQDSHIELEVTVEHDSIRLGYPNEYCQALINILNNAKDVCIERKIRHARVKVKITKETRAILIVQDNAGGIPEEILPRIFEPYFTTKENGTGIGLYMSKMIIEKYMGGKLLARNFESGAEFRIEL